MTQVYFWIIVGFIILNYVISRILDILNLKNLSEKIPKELEGIYDAQKYKDSQLYQKVKTRFGFVEETFSLIIILSMLFTGGFAYIDSFIKIFSENPVVITLLFFGIIGLALFILNLPFEIYFTFVIEEKFGFNKTTVNTFISDKLKSLLITVIIGGGLIALITWLWTITGDNFWFVVWIVITVFMAFFMMFYSNIIVPLFNKQTPLEKGELRDEIESFANKVGFKLKDIYVIDESKRTTKSNAYFTGLGPQKRIVLYDTLIKEHTTEELVAILAHEIGHYKKKHTLVSMFASILQIGLLLFIFSFFLENKDLAEVMKVSEPSFHISLLAFSLLYSPLALIIGLGMNALSRKNEYEADKFAGENYNAKALQTALKKRECYKLDRFL